MIHEQGIQDNIEYDYYPTSFLVKPIGGTIKRQKEEIQQIKLFTLSDLPKDLAFRHAEIIRDYVENIRYKETWGIGVKQIFLVILWLW